MNNRIVQLKVLPLSSLLTAIDKELKDSRGRNYYIHAFIGEKNIIYIGEYNRAYVSREIYRKVMRLVQHKPIRI